ncbi:hypothetical protein ABGB12_13590 [Actinocorallia sp. B10E7]|uniref:iron-sulfur cluster-binding protein n=1 Tax=Actinocorallia sp. B10E7 TaxID=3153558 RepID=UPI00325E2402
MPGKERYRIWTTAPRPYRIVDRYAELPGEMTLVLAPDGRDTGRAATEPQEAGAAAPGRFWVLHTESGMRIPAADVSTRPLLSDGQVGESSLVELRALRVPCGPNACRIGDRVGLAGPRGNGWNLGRAAGGELLLLGWDSGLSLLRPVVERALADSARYRSLRVWAAGAVWSAAPEGPRRPVPSGSITPVVDGSHSSGELVFDPESAVALLAGPLRLALATARRLRGQGMEAARIQVAAHELIQCGSGRCGRCLLETPEGPVRVCREGPVLRYDQLAAMSL